MFELTGRTASAARPGRARRLTLLLPVLALLAGAFSLFAPAPAEAQNTPVWSATLTQQYSSTYIPVSGAAYVYGCVNSGPTG